MNQDTVIKIREKARFEFVKQENAERVALALSVAGYYVKITMEPVAIMVFVYTDRESL